eukprot:59966-Prymnesium_polylepis.1
MASVRDAVSRHLPFCSAFEPARVVSGETVRSPETAARAGVPRSDFHGCLELGVGPRGAESTTDTYIPNDNLSARSVTPSRVRDTSD